jgi:hypothetical protein
VLEGLVLRTRRADRRAEYEAQLVLPPFPTALAYLWRSYHRIRRRKGSNGFGPSPIEWPDVAGFMRCTRAGLTPWEIETIELLDDAYLTSRQNAE